MSQTNRFPRWLWGVTALAGCLGGGLLTLAAVESPAPTAPPTVLVLVAPPSVRAVPAAYFPPSPPPQPTAEPPPPQIVTEPEPGSHYRPDPEPPIVAPILPPQQPPPVALPPSAMLAPPLPAGAPPWIANAVAAQVIPGRPAVAVVIDDMGLDRRRSTRTTQLPGPLTLSWLPYAEELPAQTRAARAMGHELMLHLPMEPSVPANPGPDALLTGLEPAEIMRRLDHALGRFGGFVGVNNHMGSRFTADRERMRPVLAEIRRRGLLWLDSRTSPVSVGMAVAEELQMPWAGRDVFLDHVMTPAEVAKALTQLENVARRTGMAVAIGHPHDVTIEALAHWLPELSRRGLTLVPLSAIVRAQHPVQLQQVGDKK